MRSDSGIMIQQPTALTAEDVSAIASERVRHNMLSQPGLSPGEVVDRILVGALGAATLALIAFAVIGPFII